jgi:hypothetical protein
VMRVLTSPSPATVAFNGAASHARGGRRQHSVARSGMASKKLHYLEEEGNAFSP